jgi:RNA polymerase primary sigma factor
MTMPATAARRKLRSTGESTLDCYLRDISVYPLISREEEAALAVRIRAGDQGAVDTLVRANCASW